MDTLKDYPSSVLVREIAYSRSAARTARANGLEDVARRFDQRVYEYRAELARRGIGDGNG